MTKTALRYGYTTGSCAAGAARAAVQGLLEGRIPDFVEVKTPSGVSLRLKVMDKKITDNYAECAIQKDAGDDPDVTHGCKVFARVERCKGNGISIYGGEGVGRVTKPGLQVPPGEAAINPVPRRMILETIEEVSKGDCGLKVTISVPGGEKLAEKTFNPKLGIVGGISIIGTTGIVKPMSEENLKTSLLCGLDVAKGLGHEAVVLVPGNLGEKSALKHLKIEKEQVVQMSNFVGFMLRGAHERGFKRIILAGHPGKLAKLISGDFDTHSSRSRSAREILLRILEEEGSLKGQELEAMQKLPTAEGIAESLKTHNRLSIFNGIADRIEEASDHFLERKTSTGVILFNMDGDMIGVSKGARPWLKDLQIG